MHELTVEATMHTVPAGLVRVTRYCVPATWLPGSVQPTVIDPLPFTVAVGAVGAERVAAPATAGALLSVDIQ